MQVTRSGRRSRRIAGLYTRPGTTFNATAHCAVGIAPHGYAVPHGLQMLPPTHKG